MELTVKDRLYLPLIFPEKGNFKQFNLKKEILRKVEITEQEREDIGLKEDPETKRIVWNVEKDVPLATDFTQDEMNYMQQCCEQMSEQELELPDDLWQLVEKIYDAIQSHNAE